MKIAAFWAKWNPEFCFDVYSNKAQLSNWIKGFHWGSFDSFVQHNWIFLLIRVIPPLLGRGTFFDGFSFYRLQIWLQPWSRKGVNKLAILKCNNVKLILTKSQFEMAHNIIAISEIVQESRDYDYWTNLAKTRNLTKSCKRENLPECVPISQNSISKIEIQISRQAVIVSQLALRVWFSLSL